MPRTEPESTYIDVGDLDCVVSLAEPVPGWDVGLDLAGRVGCSDDLGSNFDGAPDLEFRAATKALELERSGLTYQRSRPATASPTATRTRHKKRCT